MIQIGDQIPDIELENQDGEKAKLSDYRGRKVVLFAYPKANTGGCTTQACGFRDQMPTLEGVNATVLGISPDSPKKLSNWKTKENLNFDLLSDPEHEMLEALGVWGEKSMYGRKYMGVIRSHFVVGEDGEVLDAQIKVSPAKSVEKATKFLAG